MRSSVKSKENPVHSLGCAYRIREMDSSGCLEVSDVNADKHHKLKRTSEVS